MSLLIQVEPFEYLFPQCYIIRIGKHLVNEKFTFYFL